MNFEFMPAIHASDGLWWVIGLMAGLASVPQTADAQQRVLRIHAVHLAIFPLEKQLRRMPKIGISELAGRKIE
jgi:hypothetical protein